MTTTFGQLVSRIRAQLMGFAQDQAALSELAADMGATDTSFTVDSTSSPSISRGLVEIGDELIIVKSYNPTTGTVSVLGATNGRGAEGTTAAAHSAHALVTTAPAYPRARIKEAVNDTIRALYPDLVCLAATEITNLSVVYEYQMPAEATDIWYVSLQTVGPTKVWQQGKNYHFNPEANTTDFPSGKSIQVFDPVTPGRAMRVVYTKQPAALSVDSDDFATTGYAERVAELVFWGACARMLPGFDAARLQQGAVETTERAALVPPSSALKTAAYYQQMYVQALERERGRQFLETPNMTYYTA